MNIEQSYSNLKNIIQRKTNSFKAKTAFVLGSGLSALANNITDKKIIPYSAIENFSTCTVAGHDGNFVYGYLYDVPVVFLQGRPHWYENKSNEAFHMFIQAIKAFGCDSIFMTNAAGSLDPNIPVGALVGIKDHINFQFRNPLIGTTAGNKKFVGLENAYDKAFLQEIKDTAIAEQIEFHEGVYVSTLGPVFETPAEINAFRILGGQVIGMSTVPEVITARYYGLKVAVVSMISNLAAGSDKELLSHDLTLSRAKENSEKMLKLILAHTKRSGLVYK